MARLKRKEYEKLLEPLQEELVAMSRWVAHTKARVVILFEGRDTAGKGGAIGAVGGALNPRQCRTVALPAPTPRESGQWYFQRYVTQLPAAGEIALFDRSWYNRAGVEKVMDFASEDQVASFLEQVPVFEKLLVDDGILLFKYWLSCDQKKQEERFKERLDDPLKRWKLSPVDLASRDKYEAYTKAREAMLVATHTPYAPWTIIDCNDQHRGRLTLVRNLLDRMPDTRVDPKPLEFKPLKHKPAKEKYGILEPIPDYPL